MWPEGGPAGKAPEMTVTRAAEFTGPAVIVDPYSSGALFAAAFSERGVPVVAVVTGPRPPRAYASSYRPQDFPEIVVFDGDLDAMVARLRSLAPRCVIAGCESGVELAERLAPRVVPERANVPELAPARRDKSQMAAAVAAAGLRVIPQICTADPDEVQAWLERHDLAGLDLVIKPPTSASTDGVIKVPGGAAWRAIFTAQSGRINMFGAADDRLVVQRFVAGTEYLVDTFSHDGVHTVVDVGRYSKIDNGPYMAVYDTMRFVAPGDPVLPELLEYVRGVLDAVGLRFGAAHTEVMSTPEGPVLIEVGARPHGGGQPRFSEVATGDSQIHRTVSYLTGDQVPDGYDLIQQQCWVFHIARKSGTVGNTAVLDAIRRLPSHHFSVQHLTDGERVEVTRDLVGSLDLGFVVLSHPDAQQIQRDYQAIRELETRLVIDDAGPAPARTRVTSGFSAATWPGGADLYQSATWVDCMLSRAGDNPVTIQARHGTGEAALIAFHNDNPRIFDPYNLGALLLRLPPLFPLGATARAELAALLEGPAGMRPEALFPNVTVALPGFGDPLVCRGQDTQALLAAVLRAAVQDARDQEATACAVLYVPRGSDLAAEALGGLGFVCFPLAPRAVLPIPPGGFDGYLDALPASRRGQVRRDLRHIASAGVRTRRADPVADFGILLELRIAHLKGLGDQADPAAERARLGALVERLPAGDLRLLVSEHEGRPVAGVLLARAGDTVHQVTVAIDHSLAPEFTTFEIGYYAVIRDAEPGVTTYDLGIGHVEAKVRRGARLQALDGWVLPLNSDVAPAVTTAAAVMRRNDLP